MLDLERALCSVRRSQQLSNAHDPQEISGLKQAVTECQSCLESFLEKTKKSQGLAG